MNEALRERLSQHALVPQESLVHVKIGESIRPRPFYILSILFKCKESVNVEWQAGGYVLVRRQRQKTEYMSVIFSEFVYIPVFDILFNVQSHSGTDPG